MFNPYNENIKWNSRASDEMSLATMVDERLIDGEISIPHIKYKPFDKNESGQFGLSYLYKNHNQLLISIIEIFFPKLIFVPSNINKKKTYEFYLFVTINSVYNVVWYNNIEKAQDRGYEKVLKEIEDALWVLSVIGGVERDKMTKSIVFPKNKNETIKELEEFLIKHLNGGKPKEIISEIKQYFGILKLTATKEQKMITANTNLKKRIMEEQQITEEEFRKIPILGALQTKK